jgi:hypothetical protein
MALPLIVAGIAARAAVKKVATSVAKKADYKTINETIKKITKRSSRTWFCKR